ncbi:MAG TPA: adenylate/guanylate cyclase domain-containing protein [Thermoleophilaceae bacterium]
MPVWSSVRYAHNGDVSIAYTTAGESELDLLVIQGFVSHIETSPSLPLAEHFYDRLSSFARIIVFDKRGMGMSDRDSGSYTIENVSDDAVAVLDALGVERAAVLGISEGGTAATMFAATHPERVSAMVQYGTYARLSRAPDYPQGIPVEEIRGFYDWLFETWGQASSVAAWAPSMRHDPELGDWWARLTRSGVSPGALRAMSLMHEQLDVRPLLPAVRAPTLVMYRAGDTLIPPATTRTVAEGIAGARALALPGPDHLFVVNHDRIVDETEEFLTGRPVVPATDRVLATVLFTDLVESTRMAAELGDSSWRSLLEKHERTARSLTERFRGRVVKTTGDGVLATFDGPARAVRAALAIRDAAQGLGLGLRAGIHTGECVARGDDLAGIAVHIAARVEGMARPGEVVVSSTVRDLVVGSGLEFEDRGSHELKGVPDEWRLFAVVGDAEGSPMTSGEHAGLYPRMSTTRGGA